MAYFEENSEAMASLEQMVDQVGMANVLYALAHIAREKANHLRSNWQGREAAVIWDRDGARCEQLATRVWVAQGLRLRGAVNALGRWRKSCSPSPRLSPRSS